MSKFFESIQNISKKLGGDTESKTYETRKTVIEAVAGVFAFIIINKLVNKIGE